MSCCRSHTSSVVSFLAVLALLVLAFASASAQTTNDRVVDRADLLRNPPPVRPGPTVDVTGSDSAHAEASPNDPDLGEQAILKRSTTYRAFSVSFGAPISYTSNVALVRSGEEHDMIFTPSLAVAYAPRITSTLYGNVSVGRQYFFYDRFTELDFASFDARAGLAYTLPKLHNLLLRGDYIYNRLSDTGDFDAFFTNHALGFGAELPFRIGRAQQVTVGTDLNLNLDSDPDAPGRHDFGGFIGYAVNLTRSLTVSGVARVTLRDYTESDRTDVGGVLALTASYRFNKWLSANAITTLATNDSDRDVFDYDVANVGVALGVGFRF